MPGTIQSIERAVAVLRLLGTADRPLGLNELAASLDLPRPTAHGIVSTLRAVGLVDQDKRSARYLLSAGAAHLHRAVDPHDLRAAAMNWADALAGSTGLAVVLAVPEAGLARVVHHVFRPDRSTQWVRTGQRVPLHATAIGKCLLAFAPAATPPLGRLELTRSTGRTCTDVAMLAEHLSAARQRGWAGSVGEYESGGGGAAAPVRSRGGLVAGALGILGRVEELFGPDDRLRLPLADELLAAAEAIGQGVAA
ncbi:MAG TPA: IclR family transcriptional regulator [Pseudonocardia sp.]